jgi:hypothetical protein
MTWYDEKRYRLREDYDNGRITSEEFREMTAALDKLDVNKGNVVGKKTKYIIIISITIFVLSVGIITYAFLGTSEKEIQTALAENKEDSLPFYHLFMSTQGNEDRIARTVLGDTNDRGNDDFVELCASGSLLQVNEAIVNGANLNTIASGRVRHRGLSPLMAAMYNPDPEVTTALIYAGADVNAKGEFGDTALMIAAGQNPNPEMIRILVRSDANINAQNNSRRTPLMFAAQFCTNPEVITTLLQLGADPNIRDSSGKKAINEARGNISLRNTETLRRLERVSR